MNNKLSISILVLFGFFSSLLPAQNFIINPSFESTSPFIYRARLDFRALDGMIFPDEVPYWETGCSPDSPLSLDWATVVSREGISEDILVNDGVTLAPQHGNNVMWAEMNQGINNSNIKAGRFRCELGDYMSARKYRLAWYQTAHNANFLTSTGEIEVYMTDRNAIGCGSVSRLVGTVEFKDDLEWELAELCFEIPVAETWWYNAIEFRLKPPVPAVNGMDVTYFADNFTLTYGNIGPNLSHLNGLLCSHELDVDVSRQGGYTAVLDPGTPGECIYEGNGFDNPILNMSDHCNIACEPATHTLQLTTYCGGAASVYTSPSWSIRCGTSSIDLGPDVVYCEGTANPVLTGPIGHYTYNWTLNGNPLSCPPNELTPWMLTTCGPGIYCLEIEDDNGCKSSDCMEITLHDNLIKNPGFSGYYMNYSLGWGGCLLGTAKIVENPQQHCPSYPPSPIDHTGSPNFPRFLSVQGDGTPGAVVWYQPDVEVEAGLQYEFGIWLHYYESTSPTLRPDLQIRIDGQPILNLFGESGVAGPDWEEFKTVWTSPVSDKVLIEIVQTNIGVNNASSAYGIDDLSLRQVCCQVATPTNLACTADQLGNVTLFWANSPFALDWEIRFLPNDGDCGCTGPQGQWTIPQPTTGNSFPAPGFACYSWQVRSLCPDGGASSWSAMRCQGRSSACLSFPQKVAEASDQEVEIFPNPSSGHVSIRLPIADEATKIDVINMQGAIVAKLGSSALQTRVWVPGAQLPSGIYYFRITGNDLNVMKKWVYIRE